MADMVKIPEDEYEAMKATIETLEDRDVIDQIVESRKAVDEGRVRPWKDVRKEL